MNCPSRYMLLVELVATLDALILYSSSKDVIDQARERRNELMQIDQTVEPKINTTAITKEFS